MILGQNEYFEILNLTSSQLVSYLKIEGIKYVINHKKDGIFNIKDYEITDSFFSKAYTNIT